MMVGSDADLQSAVCRAGGALQRHACSMASRTLDEAEAGRDADPPFTRAPAVAHHLHLLPHPPAPL